jgi:hypothetical protein
MTEQQQTPEQKAAEKPGYLSTEFYINVVAILAGIIMASGLIPEGGVAAQIIGGVMTAIASASYTAGRSVLKKNMLNK